MAGALLSKSGIKEGSMVDAVVAVMEECFEHYEYMNMNDACLLMTLLLFLLSADSAACAGPHE